MVFKSKKMNINFKDAVGYLTFKDLEKYSFINHCYSTRLGGVSKNEHKYMNLGFSCLDDNLRVSENYNIFCASMGINITKLAVTSQIHGNKIVNVDEKNIKKSAEGFTRFENTDGLITDCPGITLATFHADCAAVYMADIKNKVVGLAHAGWKGTVSNISGALVNKFISDYNSCLENIVCALGPSIGRCCFEISKTLFEERFKGLKILRNYVYESENKEKVYVDLLEVNKNLLLKSGIKNENIFKADVCTACHKDLLFSHRATGGKRGVNMACISVLRENI